MATAGEERRRSLSAGHIAMGLVAAALGLTAAYLWLTDGNPSRPFHLQSPAPPAAVAAIMPAKDSAAAMSRSTPTAPHRFSRRSPNLPSPRRRKRRRPIKRTQLIRKWRPMRRPWA